MNIEACFLSFPSPRQCVSPRTTASLKPTPPQVFLAGGRALEPLPHEQLLLVTAELKVGRGAETENKVSSLAEELSSLGAMCGSVLWQSQLWLLHVSRSIQLRALYLGARWAGEDIAASQQGQHGASGRSKARALPSAGLLRPPCPETDVMYLHPGHLVCCAQLAASWGQMPCSCLLMPAICLTLESP